MENSALRTPHSALLKLVQLVKYFPVEENFLAKVFGGSGKVVRAVDGVSLELKRGEIFGLVGESGSGKTTLARTAIRVLEPTSGAIYFDGVDITHLGEKELRLYRRKLQMVFQDPHASLNPAMSIGDAIGHPLRVHSIPSKRWLLMAPGRRPLNDMIRERVLKILEEVGIHPAPDYYEKYPSDLSGGEKQRVVIARALILEPSLVLLDEPVAMLDMSVRAKILELLLRIQREHGITYLLITHDLATARLICDRIGILYLGRLVELGKSEEVFRNPRHPYTQSLLEAVPKPDPRERGKKILPKGEIPDAISPPSGCPFHPRCPKVFGECGWEGRDLLNLLEERWDRMGDEERDKVGDLERIIIRGNQVLIPFTGKDSLRFEGLLRSMLTNPMLEALEGMEVSGNFFSLRFKKRSIPELRELKDEGKDRDQVSGVRRVACHLYSS